VDIRCQADVRYKKPVGVYWLQAVAVETASKLGVPRAQLRIWLYRVPSLIGAIGAVLMTYWAALAFVTRRGAALAALMMASCVLLGAEARLAKTDAMLLLTVTAALAAILRAGGTPTFARSLGGDMPSHVRWQQSLGAPPGLCLLRVRVTFCPGAPRAGRADPDVQRARLEPRAQYVLAWLRPSWIVFE